MQRKPMTPIGYMKLKAELQELREVKIPANVRAIEEARAHGDLSENAEYKYAKEQQGFIRGRETELSGLLAVAEVIDPASLSGDRIMFGATVRLMDLDNDAEVTYTLVGENESEVVKGRISITSPIARGLIGRNAGDEVSIVTPKGPRVFEVVDVQFLPCDSWT
ncbi:MAG: transcription elongation factor GreA [Deltaproteobacteria bacterium CG2_30_63_29]|nr:MAG: transcription elongation factor GreA [Deltaproteobacteria bacterium CG2_30_63_29]PJB34292.1 MAG: transcription elongation factor GreA [Deltaproteobacteria bacterium CG_4_9_14_3_um_filter_63_12]